MRCGLGWVHCRFNNERNRGALPRTRLDGDNGSTNGHDDDGCRGGRHLVDDVPTDHQHVVDDRPPGPRHRRDGCARRGVAGGARLHRLGLHDAGLHWGSSSVRRHRARGDRSSASDGLKHYDDQVFQCDTVDSSRRAAGLKSVPIVYAIGNMPAWVYMV